MTVRIAEELMLDDSRPDRVKRDDPIVHSGRLPGEVRPVPLFVSTSHRSSGPHPVIQKNRRRHLIQIVCGVIFLALVAGYGMYMEYQQEQVDKSQSHEPVSR